MPKAIQPKHRFALIRLEGVADSLSTCGVLAGARPQGWTHPQGWDDLLLCWRPFKYYFCNLPRLRNCIWDFWNFIDQQVRSEEQKIRDFKGRE